MTHPQKQAHTPGKWTIDGAMASKPTWHLKNAGHTLASFYTFESVALAFHAITSYDKHCGAAAVACAEADLLGHVLHALRRVCDENEGRPLPHQHGDLQAAIDEARAVLVKAQGGRS